MPVGTYTEIMALGTPPSPPFPPTSSCLFPSPLTSLYTTPARMQVAASNGRSEHPEAPVPVLQLSLDPPPSAIRHSHVLTHATSVVLLPGVIISNALSTDSIQESTQRTGLEQHKRRSRGLTSETSHEKEAVRLQVRQLRVSLGNVRLRGTFTGGGGSSAACTCSSDGSGQHTIHDCAKVQVICKVCGGKKKDIPGDVPKWWP